MLRVEREFLLDENITAATGSCFARLDCGMSRLEFSISSVSISITPTHPQNPPYTGAFFQTLFALEPIVSFSPAIPPPSEPGIINSSCVVP